MQHLDPQSLDTFAQQLSEPVETPITDEMLREVFRQTQREILDLDASEQVKKSRFYHRWERMAKLLNDKLAAHQQCVP